MALLLTGIVLGVFALALVYYATAPVRVTADRRQPLRASAGEPGKERQFLTATSDYLVESTDRLLGRSSWVPVSARDLELAGLSMTPGTVVVMVLAAMVTTLILFATITGALFWGTVLAILVAIGAKLFLVVKIERRQKAFASQLDETLQIIASSLRAGHSFPAAVDAVAHAAQSPTAEEFARIINEHRIGRDLIVALTQTAERMDSEDFRWVAEAVAVHRETGGNLNEIIDRVGTTMRERRQIREQVYALSAEGRFSAIVLMLLPPVGVGLFALVNPGYMDPLFTTGIGRLVIVCSLVLYAIGGVWIKALTDLEY